MARPRTGSAYEKDGVIMVAISLRSDGEKSRRWVHACPERADGVPVDLIHARAVAADLQRRYDAGEWDPNAAPGTATPPASPTLAPDATKATPAPTPAAVASAPTVPAAPTVLEHARAWIKVQRYESAPKDSATIERYLAKSDFARMPVADVRAKHVLAFIRYLEALPSERGGTLAPRTVRNIYDVARRALDAAVIEELLTANPCHVLHRKLPAIEDKVPGARQGWIYSRDEVERLIADPAILPDRRVSYAVLFLTGCRFGELAALRWKDWDRTLAPLTRLTVSRAIKSVSRREAQTKTGAVKLVPVHPTLEAVLGAWHAAGWKELMGRDPTPDDLLMPSRRGNAREVHNGNRYLREDSVRLGMRPRHQHCTRHTLISLAQDDGADGSVLRWVTHAPPRSAFDGYTRQQWGRLCGELGKLRIALREITETTAPAKTTAPWLAAQRRGGFATGFATEALPARPERHETPSKQANARRKHRGIEEGGTSREQSRNDANSRDSREGDGQETTQAGRFATGFATDRSKTPGAGEGLPEGLVEALRRLEVEVERVGDEKLREAMREAWRRVDIAPVLVEFPVCAPGRESDYT